MLRPCHSSRQISFCLDRGTVHTVEAKHRSRSRNELRWTGAREGVRSPNGGSQAAQVLRTLTIPVGQEAFEVVADLIGRGHVHGGRQRGPLSPLTEGVVLLLEGGDDLAQLAVLRECPEGGRASW